MATGTRKRPAATRRRFFLVMGDDCGMGISY
jgi:hypothetical protein